MVDDGAQEPSQVQQHRSQRQQSALEEEEAARSDGDDGGAQMEAVPTSVLQQLLQRIADMELELRAVRASQGNIGAQRAGAGSVTDAPARYPAAASQPAGRRLTTTVTLWWAAPESVLTSFGGFGGRVSDPSCALCPCTRRFCSSAA